MRIYFLTKVVMPWRLLALTVIPADFAGPAISTFWRLFAWPGATSDKTSMLVAFAAITYKKLQFSSQIAACER